MSEWEDYQREQAALAIKYRLHPGKLPEPATEHRTLATQELAALLAIVQIDNNRGWPWLTVDQNRTMHLRVAELQRQLFGPEYP